MKIGVVIVLNFFMCLATGCFVYWLCLQQSKKIAVVDAVKVFGQFNMKKELEANEKVKLEVISKQADSIGNLLQMARASKNEEDAKKLSYTYSYIKQSLESEYQQSNRDINEQVWKRLNPIIDEYGKSKGLRLIIGANGMGSVLYNNEYYDLTADVIKYVNKRYEEGN